MQRLDCKTSLTPFDPDQPSTAHNSRQHFVHGLDAQQCHLEETDNRVIRVGCRIELVFGTGLDAVL